MYFKALQVFNKNGTEQIILQSNDANRTAEQEPYKFKGSFAIVSLQNKKPTYLYLGDGSYLSYQNYTIETADAHSAANLLIDGNNLTISCNQPTDIKIKNSSAKTATLTENGNKKALAIKKLGSEITLSIPTIKNAYIQIN